VTWEFFEFLTHPVQHFVCTSCTSLASNEDVKEQATSSLHLNLTFTAGGKRTLSEFDEMYISADICLSQKCYCIVY
jgi:hypothetical protein